MFITPSIFIGTSPGLVPASSAAGYFLKDDGTWVAISNGDTINIETLSDNKTLVAGTDATVQFLNANGATRNITLQTTGSPTVGKTFTIGCRTTHATYHLDIYSGATKIDEVYGQETNPDTSGLKKYMFDGTNWVGVYPGSASSATQTSLSLGRLSKASNDRTTAFGVSAVAAGDDSTAIGNAAVTTAASSVSIGSNSSVGQQSVNVGNSGSVQSVGAALGYNVTLGGSGYNVGIGSSTEATTFSTVVGQGAKDNNKTNDLLLGRASQANRVGETSTCHDFDTNKYSRSVFCPYKETTDATPVEIGAIGTATNKLTVLANSAFMFDATVIAYDLTGSLGRTWRLEGGIKRDGANNTTLIGTVVKTDISTDGGDAAAWDVAATADNTNEALIFTVTGEAATTIRWQVVIHINEVKF